MACPFALFLQNQAAFSTGSGELRVPLAMRDEHIHTSKQVESIW